LPDQPEKIELKGGEKFAEVEAENLWMWEDSVPIVQETSVYSDSTNMVQGPVWSDLSGLFAGADKLSGLMVLQHKHNPDFPGDWVQYPELSWCQPTFPASNTRYSLKRGVPLVLRFRLLVHEGAKPSEEMASILWDEFNEDVAPLPVFSFSETEYLK